MADAYTESVGFVPSRNRKVPRREVVFDFITLNFATEKVSRDEIYMTLLPFIHFVQFNAILDDVAIRPTSEKSGLKQFKPVVTHHVIRYE